MKTKTALLLCFLLGIGLTQLSAQPENKKGTGTVIDYPVVYLSWPVYCNGNQIDELWGTVTFHRVRHYENGELIWAQGKATGTAKGTLNPDEEFEIKEVDLKWTAGQTFSILHFNLIGNLGSHYIETMSLNNDTWELIFIKGVCN